MPQPLEDDFAVAIETPERRPPRRHGLNLFWRTFFLLALLLMGCILAWLQTLRAMELEPRSVQTAHQLASQINLSRAALMHSDAVARVSLLSTMALEEGLYILPREPSDRYVSLSNDALQRDMTAALRERLGNATIVASEVNQKAGLWISFDMDGDPYWFLSDLERFQTLGGRTWLIWLTVAAMLSLTGAALLARLINRPLKALSFAAGRVREGDFQASRLDERVATSEIREVNIGFNRMAQSLAKLDQDRAVMMAGISHDLRTPLARLRLETEMSVADLEARAHMAHDIAQLDAIIDKFLDYARPDSVKLVPLVLADVVRNSCQAFDAVPDMHIEIQLQDNLMVRADAVELGRILANLLENARKYGKSADTGRVHVDITAQARGNWVYMKISDHGSGVAPDQLSNLTKPFYRGEAARTAANGAGLGLAIVEKTIQRMGGVFALNNSSPAGLSANLKLQRSPPG